MVACGLAAATIGHGNLRAQPQDSEAKSEQVFATVCGRCHPVERVTATRRTRSQWEEVMTTMITARGAQISDEDFDTILTYLTKVHGRVAINRAPAADLVEVLGVSEALAASIVSYRREHGPFEDFEALMKVPGIDRGKMEAKRDAITF
jgi:competence ComEA-like helix-hairpin-helix protein